MDCGFLCDHVGVWDPIVVVKQLASLVSGFDEFIRDPRAPVGHAIHQRSGSPATYVSPWQ
jgi:hypothetical protein